MGGVGTAVRVPGGRGEVGSVVVVVGRHGQLSADEVTTMIPIARLACHDHELEMTEPVRPCAAGFSNASMTGFPPAHPRDYALWFSKEIVAYWMISAKKRGSKPAIFRVPLARQTTFSLENKSA
jgi:hypothetical protein